ncbi:MAG: hypothetical protein ACRDFB_01660 [Rhabdochlamydiaceae bacterium]
MEGVEKDTPNPFHIDKNSLDEELVKQTDLVEEWGRKLAKVRNKLEVAKRKRDVIEAEVGLKIRKDPDKFMVGKLTEKVVESLILVDEECVKANDEVIDLRYKVDLFENKMVALNDRKHGIQKLVDLRLAEYFSEPKIGGGARKKIKDRSTDLAFGPKKEEN